jgi:hypothetical protein
MIQSHQSFEAPRDQSVALWRYMDFSKFVDLLFSSELHFARSDLLGDPFEGALPETHAKAWDAMLQASLSENRAERMPTGWADMTHEQIIAVGNMITQVAQRSRQDMLISCWHMNEYESAGMWSLYSKTNESICIQTRYNLIAEELPDSCFLGAVSYINYEKDWIDVRNIFNRFLHKRKSFEHEREVRSVLWRINGSPPKEDPRITYSNDHARVKVELSKICESIYVNPNSPRWFANLVEQVVAKAGLRIPVRQSSLARDPIF